MGSAVSEANPVNPVNPVVMEWMAPPVLRDRLARRGLLAPEASRERPSGVSWAFRGLRAWTAPPVLRDPQESLVEMESLVR